MISECCILAQNECKTWHDWIEKEINWELCKKTKFNHTTKCYMQKPGFVPENETHKIFWDFAIQTDHQISAKRADQV